MAWHSPVTAPIARLFSRSDETSSALALRGEVVGLDVPYEGTVMTSDRAWNARRSHDEARDADIFKVDQILTECADGRTSRYIDLCKSTPRRDTRYGAVHRTRIYAIAGRDYTLRVPPGLEQDKEAARIAQWVATRFHETKGFKTLIGHLGHGATEGHAVLEQGWHKVGREWRTQPRWRHSNRFGWNIDTEQIGFVDGGYWSSKVTPLDGYVDQFIVHNPAGGSSDYPWQRGVVRSLLLSSVVKRLGIRYWLKMLERWGQPQVFVTLPPGDSTTPGPNGPSVSDRVMAMLRGISDDWRGMVPNGADIKTISADVAPELHEKWVEYQNRECAIALLGQNLSTEIPGGGSYAAAKAHQAVRLDILCADLAELTETITDQWIAPLVHYNFPGAPVPWIDWILAPRGQITVAEYQAGLYTGDEVRASWGWDPQPGGRGQVYAGAVIDGGAPKTELVPIADVMKGIELARDVGMRPKSASIEALLGRMGLELEAIPNAAPEPKPIPLAPTDIAKVVKVIEARGSIALPALGDGRDEMTIDELAAQAAAKAAADKAKAEAEATAAATPTPAATEVTTEADPPADPSTPIEVGAIWIDTEDKHRLRVEAIEDGEVFLVDLDSENPDRQFGWSRSYFRERCKPAPKETPT